MLNKVVFAGFGGSGVLMMGYVYALSVMKEGKEVTYLPSYGAEVRGGTANCTVVVSDEEIASPVASEPDVAVVLNTPSLLKFQYKIKKGGILIINSSLLTKPPTRENIEIYKIPASEISKELGDLRIMNIVMLGAFVKITNSVNYSVVEYCLEETFGKKKKEVFKLNKVALKTGFDYF